MGAVAWAIRQRFAPSGRTAITGREQVQQIGVAEDFSGPDLHRLIASALAGAFLFKHLVRQRQKIHWQFDACRLCSHEVDDQLVARRLLKRQISRPGASEDAGG